MPQFKKSSYKQPRLCHSCSGTLGHKIDSQRGVTPSEVCKWTSHSFSRPQISHVQTQNTWTPFLFMRMWILCGASPSLHDIYNNRCFVLWVYEQTMASNVQKLWTLLWWKDVAWQIWCKIQAASMNVSLVPF